MDFSFIPNDPVRGLDSQNKEDMMYLIDILMMTRSSEAFNPSNRSVLVATGMHYSGVSLACSLLEAGGVTMNPTVDRDQGVGSFSHFQEQILGSPGFDETILLEEHHKSQAQELISCYKSLSLWGWSNPYSSLFLEFWKSQIPDAKFILIYDAPWSILDRSYQEFEATFDKNLHKFIELWSQYSQAISSFCSMYPQDCLLVSFDSLCYDPEGCLQEIKTRLTSQISISPISRELMIKFKDETFEKNRLQYLITHQYSQAIALYETLNKQALTTPNWSHPNSKLTSDDNLSIQWNIEDWLYIKKRAVKVHEANQLIEALKDTLKWHIRQLHKTQEELQNVQIQNQEKDWMIRRFQFQQSVAQDFDASYQYFVWEAWAAYCQGDFFEMVSQLQKSQRYSNFSKTEFIIDWLNRFLQFSIHYGESFDSENLTNLPEWQNLVNRIVVT